MLSHVITYGIGGEPGKRADFDNGSVGGQVTDAILEAVEVAGMELTGYRMAKPFGVVVRYIDYASPLLAGT